VTEPASLAELEAAIPGCARCPELRAYAAEVARVKRRAYRDEAYWGRPVPGFGDPLARCVLVGLAPGAHGSNRTGRMFTGDASGRFLYRALYRAGFASQPASTHRGDALRLDDCFITAALRCAPPANAPTPAQLVRCEPHLDAEFALLARMRVVIGLGAIGTRAAVLALRRAGSAVPRFAFAHGVRRDVEASTLASGGAGPTRNVTLLTTYHPSAQNTNTGRLTEGMLDAVFAMARIVLDRSDLR